MKTILKTKRYTIEELQLYAIDFGGKCLSKEYTNESTPLEWRCEIGHTWDARFQIIKQGGWCPQCIKHRKKELILEDIKEIVAKKGYKCLSKEYINDYTKLEFKCSQGHIWMASPNNIKQGSGCRKCADILNGFKKRDSIESFYKIAMEHGGKCLSKIYTLSYDKLEFQCAEGHIWKTKAVNVKNKRWCPKCAYTNRQNNHRDSIEIYRKIAKERGGKCLSTEYINSHEKLKFQCSEKHQWSAIAIDVKRENWCPSCGHKLTGEKGRDSIELFHKIAKEHGGKCLSKKYITCDTKLVFQCAKKHQWMTRAANIKKGCWCPNCGYEKIKERLRDSIEKYQKIAKHKGGRLLSVKYENINSPLLWQCRKGHKWKANARTIVYQNKWCSHCISS